LVSLAAVEDRQRLAAVVPPHRVDLGNSASIVNRERALAMLIGLQPVPRDLVWRAAAIKT
jgi:hypothetical protein